MTDLIVPSVVRPGSPRTGPQSLERALDLLEHLAQGEEPQRFTDLHRDLGIPRPVLSRLLKALVERGYVQRDGDGRAYRRGASVLGLSRGLNWAPHSRKALSAVGQRAVDRLCNDTGQTSMLLHWNGRCLESVATATAEEGLAPWPVGTRRDQFQRGPWGVSVFASDDLIGREMEERQARDDRSMSLAELRAGVRDIHQRGWTVLRRPHSLRVVASIFAPDQRLVGVIGLFAHPAQCPDADASTWGEMVLQAAARIATDLGARSPGAIHG